MGIFENKTFYPLAELVSAYIYAYCIEETKCSIEMYCIIKKGIAMNMRHLRGFLLGQNLFFNATGECFDIVDRMSSRQNIRVV